MPDITQLFAERATLRRSATLLTSFRYERSAPERFYGVLAQDTVDLIADLWQQVDGRGLQDRTVLDVGGGPGYFASAFANAGARYIGVEPDAREMHAAPEGHCGIVDPRTTHLRASGMALPLASNSVDICLSSNVAEHVPQPWRLGEEMLRVTRPGGLAILSYTVWLGPFGGHEMGLTHYFGGARAARWYTRKHGHRPKNNYGTSLFPVSVRDGLRWARSTGTLVAAFPRYHPRWAWWITKVPAVREVLVSNVVLVLRPH